MFFTILCYILLAVAAVLCFISAPYAAVTAFMAMCASALVSGIDIGISTYIFWGVAMIIVLSLNFILPAEVSASRRGLPYISGASLAGTILGLAMASHAAIICGAVLGAALGGIAYGLTPRGRMLDFPSGRFFNYLCAKGFPVAIAMSCAGITAAWLLYL